MMTSPPLAAIVRRSVHRTRYTFSRRNANSPLPPSPADIDLGFIENFMGLPYHGFPGKWLAFRLGPTQFSTGPREKHFAIGDRQRQRRTPARVFSRHWRHRPDLVGV